MSTLTATSPLQADAGQGYVQNVIRAARALLTALFAVAPAAPRASTNAETRSEAVSSRDLFRLYQMANQYDSVMPNLAQEIRAIAVRNAG